MSAKRRHLEVVFFVLVFGISLYLVWLIARPFLNLIMLSVVFSVAVYPIYTRMLKLLRGHTQIATWLTLIVVSVVIGIPLYFFSLAVIAEMRGFQDGLLRLLHQQNNLLNEAARMLNDVNGKVHFTNDTITATTLTDQIQGMMKPAGSLFAGHLLSIGTKTVNIITQAVLFVILVVAILPSVTTIKKLMFRLSPYDDRIDQKYTDRVLAMTRAMLRGTVVIALVQGVYSGFILWLFGVPYVLLLTVVMVLLSLVPVVGTIFVNLPTGILMILTGNVFGGIVVILNQAIIVSNIDNVLRPMLVSKEADMHPALLLLAIFGGLKVFGPFAFIYGPVIMIIFTTTLELYLDEFKTEFS